ncbi:MAG: hypothetical protein HGN29_07395 [Asgard group archaeon]|nr:hypothetical protein [Asgard group archaeon]
MKYPFKEISSLLLAFLLFFSLFHQFSLASTSEIILYTRITDISFPPILSDTNNFQFTDFDFTYTLEIINPTETTVIVTTPNTNLILVRGNCTLENNQYFWIVGDPYIPQPAESEHHLEPGVTKMERIFIIHINEPQLETIPNGNYTIWVILVHENEIPYYSYLSFLNVTDDEISVTHEGTNSTLIVDKELYRTFEKTDFNITAVLIYFAILIFRYRKNRNRIRNN